MKIIEWINYGLVQCFVAIFLLPVPFYLVHALTTADHGAWFGVIWGLFSGTMMAWVAERMRPNRTRKEGERCN